MVVVWVAALLGAMLAPASTVYAQSNNQPAFSSADYTFYMSPGAAGSSIALTVGSVAAADSDSGDTLVYGLRSSDSSDRMYMVGRGSAALYSVDTGGADTGGGDTVI